VTDIHSEQTIYALASAPGSAGVSVIRVSGSQSYEIGRLLTNRIEIETRKAIVSSLFHPETKRLIDKALLIYFKNPNSFTGEDILELHVHGSSAIVRTLFDALEQFDNVRMAEPGEFSKRAYLNGKMDLTEAEAISDLVVAETEAQLEQALSQMSGSLRDLYEGWAKSLSKSLAYIEADIDFADDDVPDNLSHTVLPKILEISEAIRRHLDDDNKGEIVREGIKVAVIGAPNAGKSSLMNCLARRDVAIVSDIAGTTRDVIETHLNIAGYPVILMDTAGLRETADVVEKIGVEKAVDTVKNADLKLAVVDGSSPEGVDVVQPYIDNKTIVVFNKTDINPHIENSCLKSDAFDIVGISAKNNTNIDALIGVFKTWINHHFGAEKKSLAPTRERHRQHLNATLVHLDRAHGNLAIPELFAEDVRLAVRELGKITGRVDVEDLLDVIFRDFCLGK